MRKVISIITIILVFVAIFYPAMAIARDKESDLVKVVEVHYKKAKNGGGTYLGELSPTYKIAGLRWANPLVNYKVSTDSSKVDSIFTLDAVNTSFNTWETEYNNIGRSDKSNIDYNYDSTQAAKYGAVYNGENTVSWGAISNNGIIAQTTYWYNRRTRLISEFDIVMNSNLAWATDGNSSAFDIQNIATHEVGHTLVLSDLYKSNDNALTMYGYSSPGDTSKRDLGLGDCLGVEKIYPVI